MSIYLDFSGIDDGPAAKAVLIGLAQVGMLHARTVPAIDSINKVAEIEDWREPIAWGFLDKILVGDIRTDAKWSRGPESSLERLANAVKEYQGETDVPAA